jgi:hypothetical protein
MLEGIAEGPVLDKYLTPSEVQPARIIQGGFPALCLRGFLFLCASAN